MGDIGTDVSVTTGDDFGEFAIIVSDDKGQPVTEVQQATQADGQPATEIQKMTDKCMKDIEAIIASKDKEIMEL